MQDGRKENLEGFVKTFDKELSEDAHPGIFALDCEMVSHPAATTGAHQALPAAQDHRHPGRRVPSLPLRPSPKAVQVLG